MRREEGLHNLLVPSQGHQLPIRSPHFLTKDHGAMRRILITDDSQFQRKTLSAIIQKAGYEVETATNGREALAQIEANPPDCLILDMLMPEIDGIQVLETLQAKQIRLPVIVLTADIQEWMKIRCLELGASAFLNKPVTQDILRMELNQILSPSHTQGTPCR